MQRVAQEAIRIRRFDQRAILLPLRGPDTRPIDCNGKQCHWRTSVAATRGRCPTSVVIIWRILLYCHWATLLCSGVIADEPPPRDPPSALSSRLPPPKRVDLRRAAAAGIRTIEGQHLRLLTDLPPSEAVDQLPQAFDAAVPLWAEYFGVPPHEVANWDVQGFLVDDRERFAAIGLLPRDNPNFTNGYAHAEEFWLKEQPSDYYRRHLLLHEGTHSFMYAHLGGAGPGWYMEGLAELLGTHRWNDGELTLGAMPADKAETPMWGRIKFIRDAVADGRVLPIEAILQFDNRRGLENDQYGWAWALATLLDKHPRYQQRFRALQREVKNPRFNQRFRELFADDWDQLQLEWQAYAATLDYGYDVAAMAMVHREPKPVGERPRSARIDARRGWQSTGWLLSAGQEYEVNAEGRYRIADDGQPWISEPGGVTIDYHDGRPLGMLLGALAEKVSGTFSAPIAIGLETKITPERDSVLYARVSDSPSQLSDNAGEIVMRVRQVDTAGNNDPGAASNAGN